MNAPAGKTVSPGSSAPPASSESETISLYHYLVVILAASGWLFDCMGQRIFVLSRQPALTELLGPTAADKTVALWGTLATTAMMVGWATGGILFGMMSDRYGRVKAMITTLLAYTIFSGLSGFARSGLEFLIWRLLFGLGVGGMFGSATTLVAESVPRHFRTIALGSMQAFSACGNMLASALSLKITPGQENLWGHFSGWQVLSFVGVFPAIMAIPMILVLKEPEPWRRAKAEAATGNREKKVGSIGDLFRHPRWRKNLLIGVFLGVSGMVGLWGIAFFSPELISTAFKNRPLQVDEVIAPAKLLADLKTASTPAMAHLKARLSPEVIQKIQSAPDSGASADVLSALAQDLNRLISGESLYNSEVFQGVALKKSTKNLVQLVEKRHERQDVNFLNRQLVEQTFPKTILELQSTIDKTKGKGTFLQDVGSLTGMFTFTFVAAWFSRRTAFLSAFALCLVIVSFVFYSLQTVTDVYWMLPMVGFTTLSVFAGYSIYFPELFPTRLRGTGVGFCYNTVRYLAAPFPLLLGWLSTHAPFRTVAVAMCAIYLVGIVALIWAPETKGKPLPED